MLTIELSKERILSVLNEIDRLKQSDFPYPDSIEALNLIEKIFKQHEKILSKLYPTSDIEVINNACKLSLNILYIYVPILGFILRSTNIWNAFEAYFPLLRLAQRILGDNTSLIISSEWDYSPFIYNAISELPDFLLIGLPAPETSNPLLLPLAGHELGHSVWAKNKFSNKFDQQIRDKVKKQIKENHWNDYKEIYPHIKLEDIEGLFNQSFESDAITSYTWSLLQVEEIFCDFFGLFLFAESYLHAFAYLISPGTGGQRSLAYPNLKQRIKFLIYTAKKFEINIPERYEDWFEDSDEPKGTLSKLLVKIADIVSSSLIDELIDLVKSVDSANPLPKRNLDNVDIISSEFKNLISPTSNLQTLTDILVLLIKYRLRIFV